GRAAAPGGCVACTSRGPAVAGAELARRAITAPAAATTTIAASPNSHHGRRDATAIGIEPDIVDGRHAAPATTGGASRIARACGDASAAGDASAGGSGDRRLAIGG